MRKPPPPSRSALSLSASLLLCVRSCPALLLVLSAKLLVGDSRALSREPRLGRIGQTGGILSAWFGCGVGCRSGIIDSDKDRPLIISGYTPANMGTWMGYQPDPIFLNRCKLNRMLSYLGCILPRSKR